jgi:hypothetical protein
LRSVSFSVSGRHRKQPGSIRWNACDMSELNKIGRNRRAQKAWADALKRDFSRGLRELRKLIRVICVICG